MKLSICLLVAFLGLAMAVDVNFDKDSSIEREKRLSWENAPLANSTRCVYLPESKQLSCKWMEQVIECDAVCERSALGSSRSFSIFGIGKLSAEFSNSSIESIRYFLYPRDLNNQTYYNYSMVVDGKVIDLVLYYGESGVETGLRIPNLRCYERLVNLFRQSTEHHIVKLEGSGSEVQLIGEILSNDKNVQKRWLWGYGWGLGYPWGWGGLGYGYGLGLGYYWG